MRKNEKRIGKKRFLAGFLSLAMVLTMTPVQGVKKAEAAETGKNIVSRTNVSSARKSTADEHYDNGFCKHYELTEDGTWIRTSGTACTDASGNDCSGYEPAKLTTDKYDMDNDGTKDNVYEISNAGQLYWFAALVNGTLDGVAQNDANAVLTANITVNENLLNTEGELSGATHRVWTPIGKWHRGNSNISVPYKGCFDGKGYSVSGIYKNEDSDSDDYPVGLFGGIEAEGSVFGVRMTDSWIQGTYNVGGIVGLSLGKVKDCSFQGRVTGSVQEIGGICGYGRDIVACTNTGRIEGNYQVGGISGLTADRNSQSQPVATAQIKDCENTGEVIGNRAWSRYIGGICGAIQRYATETDSVSVTGCVNRGRVTAEIGKAALTTSNINYVGGICGSASAIIDSSSATIKGVTVENCTNEADITADASSVGGIGGTFGRSDKEATYMINCRNTGTITGRLHGWAGGLCGWGNGGAKIKCSRNEGDVISSADDKNIWVRLGGICGRLDSTAVLQNCANTGAVQDKSTNMASHSIGGICGYMASADADSVQNCYSTGALAISDTSASEVSIGGIYGSYTAGTTIPACVKNSYYLEGCAGDQSLSNTEGTAKPEASFTSGEVTYLLSQGTDGTVWKQTLSGEGKDSTPSLSADSKPVYCGVSLKCDGTQKVPTIYAYTNSSSEAIAGIRDAHSYRVCTGEENYHSCRECGGGKAVHDYTYIVTEEGDAIRAVCRECDYTYTVKLISPAATGNQVFYDGTAKQAETDVTAEAFKETLPAVAYASVTDGKESAYETTAPTKVGTYRAKLTLGTVSATVDFKIVYMETDKQATAVNAEGVAEEWLDGDVTLKAPEGFLIAKESLTEESNWKESITYQAAELEEGTYGAGADKKKAVYYLRVKDGTAITDKLYASFGYDNQAPIGDIQIKKDSIKSLASAITFGYFFKDSTTVTITGTDTVSGIRSIEYQEVAKKAETDTASPDDYRASANAWKSLTLTSDGNTGYASYQLAAPAKSVILARITDRAGHVTIINSDGVVVYSDVSKASAEAVYAKRSGEDVDTGIVLYGNTVKKVKNGSSILTADTDYTVQTAADAANSQKLILKSAYLETLAVSDTAYELTVTYNPCGESYAAKPDANGQDRNDVPVQSTITLTVQKSVPKVIKLPITESFTYDPARKLGSVVITGGAVVGAADENLTGTWSWKDETIVPTPAKKTYTAVFTPEDQTYGTVEAEVTVTVEQSGGGNGGSGISGGGGSVVSRPTASPAPSSSPTVLPSASPSATPDSPTTAPTEIPSTAPDSPTAKPTAKPSSKPSAKPSGTKLKDSAGTIYKVTSAKSKTPTVAYVAPKSGTKNTVTIPATVKIGKVTYKVTSIADNTFKNNKKITKVVIGRNIIKIGKNAFAGCTKLTTITIGKNVITIGKNAFAGCKNLKTIIIKSKKLTKKSVSKGAFSGISKKVIVKVPKSRHKAYKKLLRMKGLSKKVKTKSLKK